jgi:heme exporter protein A
VSDGGTRDAAIEVSGLVKRFGPVVALDGVELRVERGESVALFGPNGAGKTTLVRVLTLGLRPDAGSFRILGLDPRREDRSLRAAIGLLSHQTFLYDDLTAQQNLAFFASLYGLAEPSRRAAELLARFELADRAADAVGSLSRGMQQRVALARALVHDPPLVLLDEPFTGLDPHAALLLRETIAELRARGTSLLWITHDLRQGLELSDRWLLLSAGRVLAEGVSGAAETSALERFFAGPRHRANRVRA